MKTTYMPADTYHRMLDALEEIAKTFDPAAPDDVRTRIMMAVGDEGGIWPETCLVDQSVKGAM